MKKGKEIMTKKLIAVIGVIIAILILFTACSATAATKPEPVEGAETCEISGECWVEVGDGIVTVYGTSDIMEGTNGTISVYSSVGKEYGLEKITQAEENGILSAEFKIEDNWADDVYGFLVFDTSQSDRQLDEVKAVYGDKFQNIVGDNTVFSSQGVAVVFQSKLAKIR